MPCDTAAAFPDATAPGTGVIFVKNSDRDRNEPHEVLQLPAQTHAGPGQLQCTYIEIPQARRTYQVLLCKPVHVWGAEMGGNEHGVVVGNEALFPGSRAPPVPREGGLTGLDLVRLALERGSTAREALDTITGLLQAHGQGGDCGFDAAPLFYFNAFLIVDRAGDGYHVETAGREWAARRVQSGVAAISNVYSLGDLTDADERSEGLRDTADLRAAFGDQLFARFGCGDARRERLAGLMSEPLNGLTVTKAMEVLRDHGLRGGSKHSEGMTGVDICMHAGCGPVRVSQTTGSLVAHLPPAGAAALPLFLVTGSSAPCLSVFKPVWLVPGDAQPRRVGQAPGRTDDGGRSLWWAAEVFHRAALSSVDARTAERIARAEDRRKHLEHEFVRASGTPRSGDAAWAVTDACLLKEVRLRARWSEELMAQARCKTLFMWPSAWLYAWAWGRADRGLNAFHAGLPPTLAVLVLVLVQWGLYRVAVGWL